MFCSSGTFPQYLSRFRALPSSNVSCLSLDSQTLLDTFTEEEDAFRSVQLGPVSGVNYIHVIIFELKLPHCSFGISVGQATRSVIYDAHPQRVSLMTLLN